MKIILSIFFLLMLFATNAQNKCPGTSLYRTALIGESRDSLLLKLPLYFQITSDSITASLDVKGRAQFLAFRILNKECDWDNELKKGKTIYKTMLSDKQVNKYPIVTIDFTDAVNRYIEVLYENGRLRVFSVVPEDAKLP